MSKTDLKRKSWLKKKKRTKKSLGALGKHPRLVVYKSNRHIYSQLLDDNSNQTLMSSSSMDKKFDVEKCKSKIDMSTEIGYNIADKMKKKKINEIIFDRNGYLYHGRIKAVAEALREKGIKI